MDDAEIAVRAAAHSDLDVAIVGGPAGEYRDQLIVLIGGLGGVVLMVAELAAADGAVVGRIGVRTSGAGAEILGLVVDELWQRRGVGTALMDAAEAWALGQGCKRVRLTVGQDNNDAVRLYDGRGYRVVGTSMSEGLIDATGAVVHEPEPVWVCRKDLR